MKAFMDTATTTTTTRTASTTCTSNYYTIPIPPCLYASLHTTFSCEVHNLTILFGSCLLLVIIIIITIIIISSSKKRTLVHSNNANNKETDDSCFFLPEISSHVSRICCRNNQDKITILQHAIVFRYQYYSPNNNNNNNNRSPITKSTNNNGHDKEEEQEEKESGVHDASLISLYQRIQYRNYTPLQKSITNNNNNNDHDDDDYDSWRVFLEFVLAWCFPPFSFQEHHHYQQQQDSDSTSTNSPNTNNDKVQIVVHDIIYDCTMATLWLFQDTFLGRTNQERNNMTGQNCTSCCLSVEVIHAWMEQVIKAKLHSCQLKNKNNYETKKNEQYHQQQQHDDDDDGDDQEYHDDFIQIDSYRRYAHRILEYLQMLGILSQQQQQEEKVVAKVQIHSNSSSCTQQSVRCQIKWKSHPIRLVDNNNHTNNNNNNDTWRYDWCQRLEMEYKKYRTTTITTSSSSIPNPKTCSILGIYMYETLPWHYICHKSYHQAYQLLTSHEFCQERLACLGIKQTTQQHIHDFEQLLYCMKQGLEDFHHYYVWIGAAAAVTTDCTGGADDGNGNDIDNDIDNDGHSDNKKKVKQLYKETFVFQTLYSTLVQCLLDQQQQEEEIESSSWMPMALGKAFFELGMSYRRLKIVLNGNDNDNQHNMDVAAFDMLEYAYSIQQTLLINNCCSTSSSGGCDSTDKKQRQPKGSSSIAKALFNLSIVYKVRQQKEVEKMCLDAEMELLQCTTAATTVHGHNVSNNNNNMFYNTLSKGIVAACGVYQEHVVTKSQDLALSLYFNVLRNTLLHTFQLCQDILPTLRCMYEMCPDPRYTSDINILLSIMDTIAACCPTS